MSLSFLFTKCEKITNHAKGIGFLVSFSRNFEQLNETLKSVLRGRPSRRLRKVSVAKKPQNDDQASRTAVHGQRWRQFASFVFPIRLSR